MFLYSTRIFNKITTKISKLTGVLELKNNSTFHTKMRFRKCKASYANLNSFHNNCKKTDHLTFNYQKIK